MMSRPQVRDRKRSRLVAHDARIRECRACHLRGYLDEIESVPIVRDPEPDAPVPRILLVGQAPGLRATLTDRPFAGIAGDKLRSWFEQGGIPTCRLLEEDPFRGRHPLLSGPHHRGAGDRVPSIAEQALCRPWLDETDRRRSSRRSCCCWACWRSGPSRAGSRRSRRSSARPRSATACAILPLPHPSGVSRWLNEAENVEAVARSMAILKGWVEELGI